MLGETLPAPTLITKPEAFQRMVETLVAQPIVAVDTESNSLYAYREQVCLIQFSTPNEDYLLDPFSVSDLAALAPLFVNPAIEKVFHAAEYDIICLKRDFGFEFANLFDTMLAARILGRSQMGLGALLKSEFGIVLDKRFQRADWGQRPLPTELLAYARLDTHYLIPLRQRLFAALQESGLWPLAHEDFNRIRSVNGRPNDDARLNCWHLNGAHELAPQQMAVLQELCEYRDLVARTQDRPLFKVLSNETLVALAAACPLDLESLRGLRGMSPAQIRRHGKSIVEAVKRGLHAPPIYPTRTPRPDERYLARLEALRQWRKATAQAWGVESDVVLPRELMFALAEAKPLHLQALAEVMCEYPWRLEHFGEAILAALQQC